MDTNADGGTPAAGTVGWRLVTLAVVLGLVLAAGGAAPVEARAGDGWTRRETRSYSTGDVGPLLGGPVTSGCGGGVACFGWVRADHLTVTIRDGSGRRVGGVLHVTDSGGWTRMYRQFCGSLGRTRLVPGYVRVHLDAPGDVRGLHSFGGPGCTEIEPVGATLGATSGIVHATFTGTR